MEYIKETVTKYWAEIVLGGAVTTVCTFFRKYFALKKGVQALLRAQIIQIFNKYIERGYVPIYERENIDGLYAQYKALGGNGTITKLVGKLNELPTEEAEH